MFLILLFDFASFCILFHIMYCIHEHFNTLALELIWNVELVFACARVVQLLADHGWLSSLDSVEYLL